MNLKQLVLVVASSLMGFVLVVLVRWLSPELDEFVSTHEDARNALIVFSVALAILANVYGRISMFWAVEDAIASGDLSLDDERQGVRR